MQKWIDSAFKALHMVGKTLHVSLLLKTQENEKAPRSRMMPFLQPENCIYF